jgi:hypothetical protein
MSTKKVGSKGGGMNMANPGSNINYTVGHIPIPTMNISQDELVESVQKIFQIEDQWAINLSSFIDVSQCNIANETNVSDGVASGTTHRKTDFDKGSSILLIMYEPAVCEGHDSVHNTYNSQDGKKKTVTQTLVFATP